MKTIVSWLIEYLKRLPCEERVRLVRSLLEGTRYHVHRDPAGRKITGVEL